MSWIAELGSAFGEDMAMERQEYEERLNGYMHENIYGEEVNVHTIDKRYAHNLINWYRRRTLMSDEEFYQKPMIEILQGIVKEDEQ